MTDLQQRYGASLRKQVKKVRRFAPGCRLQLIPMFCADGGLAACPLHMHVLRQGKSFLMLRPVVSLSTLCAPGLSKEDGGRDLEL
jgi:hypothetical protein